MKVKNLIKLLQEKDENYDIQVVFTHTNYKTFVVPNNVMYEGVKNKVLLVEDPANNLIQICSGD